LRTATSHPSTGFIQILSSPEDLELFWPRKANRAIHTKTVGGFSGRSPVVNCNLLQKLQCWLEIGVSTFHATMLFWIFALPKSKYRSLLNLPVQRLTLAIQTLANPVLPSGILKPLEYVRLTKSVSSRFQNFVTGQTWSVYFLIFLASFVRSSWVSEQWP